MRNDRLIRMGFLAFCFLTFSLCEIYVLLHAFLQPLRPANHEGIVLGGFAGLWIEQMLEPDWREKLTKPDFNPFRNPYARSLLYAITIAAGGLGRFETWSLTTSIVLFTVLVIRLGWLVFAPKQNENSR